MKKKRSIDQVGTMHHYVPRGYLKRFATPGNSNHVVSYELGRKPYVTNIRKVAVQRDFYTYIAKDGSKVSALEDAFADVDTEGVGLLRVLDTMPDGYVKLSEEQKGALLSYIAFQHIRNLQERKLWAASYEQMSRIHMQVVASNKEAYHTDAKKVLGEKYNHDIVEVTRQMFLKGDAGITFDPLDQHFIGATLDMSNELYRILFALKKMVLVSKTSEATNFVTSDNPVTHYLTEEQKIDRPHFLGVGYIEAVFQFPISPTRCLLLIMEMETFQYDQDAVDYINFHTYHFANRWVFSNSISSTTMDEFSRFKRRTPIMRMESPFGTAEK